jgi:hypothetical protein
MGESGQALIESALVLPLNVVLLLGTVQLAVLQQARILTEYAAYSAARTGIVWSVNNERMRDAALVALLPTFGSTGTFEALERTWQRARREDAWMHDLMVAAGTPGTAPLRSAGLLGRVRVDVVSPRLDGSWEELDFDAADTFSDGPELVSGRRRFMDPNAPDPAAHRRESSVLAIRLRYWFELEVPFASWFVFHAWHAAQSSEWISGPVESTPAKAPDKGLEGSGPGWPLATREELRTVWSVAAGESTPGGAHRFFVPVIAESAMRMQSNVHRKWLVHGVGDEQ